MSEVTKEEIGKCITGLVASFDRELKAKTKDEIAAEWYWKWNDKVSIERNVYDFFDMLNVHRSQCRRWEEMHNGSCCVVERVRDTYLMPRIREFLLALVEKGGAGWQR